jgi:hypothetical protein
MKPLFAATVVLVTVCAALGFSRATIPLRAAGARVQFCPTCEGTRQAIGLPGEWDRTGRYFHDKGFAWAPPTQVRNDNPHSLHPVARCPRCQGRGLIGG